VHYTQIKWFVYSDVLAPSKACDAATSKRLDQKKKRGEPRAATVRVLRSVLQATGGNARIEQFDRVMKAEEAAAFLGVATDTLRDLTYRHEVPFVRTGKRGVGYRVVDLIQWQEDRIVDPLPALTPRW
jgi:excisionase family DNA binding protein